MEEFESTFYFFQDNSIRFSKVENWEKCQNFIKDSESKEWIYLIKFNTGKQPVYAWGTASGKGERIRKSSIFHSKLTGKYDRRVDYLMLKIVYGEPIFFLFEMSGNAVEIEQKHREELHGPGRTGACIRGLLGLSRHDIALEIYDIYKKTEFYLKIFNENEKNTFEDFVKNYWLNKLKHPKRNHSFYYGDCLEPNFLDKVLERPDLIKVIEKGLRVNF